MFGRIHVDLISLPVSKVHRWCLTIIDSFTKFSMNISDCKRDTEAFIRTCFIEKYEDNEKCYENCVEID